MSAEADAGRAVVAASALRGLAAAIVHGGDVVPLADSAAARVAEYTGRPCDRDALVGLGAEELAAFADRLDLYADAATR